MPKKSEPPLYRRPVKLALVEPEVARVPAKSYVPETLCLVAVDRSLSKRWLDPHVRHLGDDCYEVSGGGWIYSIGPVKRLGAHMSRAVSARRGGDTPIRGQFGGSDNSVDLDVLAAVIAICGGAVTWTEAPPVWWPHGGGKI